MPKEKIIEPLAIVAERLQEAGVPSSQWCFLQKPARIEFLGRDKQGFGTIRTLPFKRSWGAERIDTWSDAMVEALRDTASAMADKTMDDPEDLELWQATKKAG